MGLCGSSVLGASAILSRSVASMPRLTAVYPQLWVAFFQFSSLWFLSCSSTLRDPILDASGQEMESSLNVSLSYFHTVHIMNVAFLVRKERDTILPCSYHNKDLFSPDPAVIDGFFLGFWISVLGGKGRITIYSIQNCSFSQSPGCKEWVSFGVFAVIASCTVPGVNPLSGRNLQT